MSLPDEKRPDATAARLTGPIRRRPLLVEAGAIGAGLIVFLVSVLPNLANHPAVTDDEVWVMSASFKLAHDGIFGSDMFRGFFDADRFYFFNMPGHHFAVAAAFKVIGDGIAQARLVGVAYGVATIVLTYALARRLYGIGVAVLALGLLLFLRFNMGFDTGLPLQELAASVRYDLAPVPFLLGGVLLLLAPPSLFRAVAAGLLFGIATLMQFYGVFIIPVALAFLAFESVPRKERAKLAGGLLAAAALTGLPYGAVILAHFDDFRGQAGTIDDRADFLSPGFYVESLGDEPQRFTRPLAFKEVPKGEDPRKVNPRFLSLRETLTRRPSAKIAVLVGLPAAIVFAGRRALRERSRGDRLLLFCLAGLTLQYALFESLKLYIYWIPVVPFLCVGIAATALHLLRSWRADRVRLLAAAAAGACLLVFFAEGGAARISGLRAASSETGFDGLTRAVHGYVPAGSRVVGSTSLWWGLRDTDYRSYFLFFYLTAPNAREYRTTIPAFLDYLRPQYLVLTRLGTEELEKHLTAKDRQEFEAYKSQHATLVARLEGPEFKSYGYVDIWRFQ